MFGVSRTSDRSGPHRAWWLGMLLVAVAIGCGGGGGKSDGTDTDDDDDGNDGRRTVNRQNCSDLLETALSTLQPDQYEVGDTTGAVTLLANWQNDCITPQLEATRDAMVGERTRGRLDAETLVRVESNAFTEQDAAHVRTSLLFRTVAVAAAGRAESDREVVRNVFGFVVRNVQLVEEDDPLAGNGAFESFLFGEGSARDRAWIVAALLRQLRIDAVIVRPASDADDADAADDEPTGERWLLGVLVDGECHLFDPRLGLPVPGPDDDGATPLPVLPATLADVRGDGDLLGRLDAPDFEYPLDDSDLDEVEIEVVLNSSGLAPRLIGLQGILGGKRNVLVLDSLDDPEGRLGRRNVLDRVADDVDGLSVESVGVWTYPEACLVRDLSELEPSVRTAVLGRREVFLDVLRDGRRILQHARLQHLRARYTSGGGGGSSAVEAYTGVLDVADGFTGGPVEEAIRDAQFWMTICQLESGGGRSAEIGLESYVSAPWNGRFERSALLAMALGRAERGSTKSALTQLDRITEPGPDAALVAYLRQRWTEEDEPPAEEPKPTDPKDATPTAPTPTDDPTGDSPGAKDEAEADGETAEGDDETP